jgi:hypothetical protein
VLGRIELFRLFPLAVPLDPTPFATEFRIIGWQSRWQDCCNCINRTDGRIGESMGFARFLSMPWEARVGATGYSETPLIFSWALLRHLRHHLAEPTNSADGRREHG